MTPFPCNQCGACCRRVALAAETQWLDRGDGACRHFDFGTRACTIYDTRPDVCRVDRQYALRYSDAFTRPEFVALNVQVCESLQAS